MKLLFPKNKFNIFLNKLQKRDTEFLSNLFLTYDLGYFENINNSLIQSLKKLENLENSDLVLFYKNSSKHFDSDSLDNITSKITRILL